MIIKLTKEKIESLMSNGENPNTILNLFKFTVPHFDHTQTIKMGAVQISNKTAEFIIDCLKKTDGGVAAVMTWVNVGFSVDPKIEDWKAIINMDKIVYEEE